MIEVAPRIHRIEAPFMGRFVCMYLLVGDLSCLLVDTGTDPMPGEFIVPYLDEIGVDPSRIRYVVNTHADFDHTAGNASVQELNPKAVFMCHAFDQVMVEDIERMIEDRYSEYEADHGIGDGDEAKEFIRSSSRHVNMDIALQGGEQLRLGADWCVEILHTAGHSRGHVSVHDASSRSLIIADSTLHNAVPLADGSPAFPPTYRYTESYLASMGRFRSMDFDLLLTSHYPICHGAVEIGNFLGESRAFVDRVESALERELQGAETGRALRELTENLGTALGEWPQEASSYLCFPFLGHLERMERHGKVKTGRRDGLLSYIWSGATA
ncbi:MAG: MBL fold metallo-hydrolase [Candidatus Latescibacterota bacterium]|nr:MBL fold metallo-hydrolase [Candidatus Latescibacterota bacterium]